MITHYLGDAEVEAYLRELSDRLENLGKEMPTEWLPIGNSGRILARKLLEVSSPELVGRVRVYVADYDRVARSAFLEVEPADALTGRRVFVIDSSVHSGDTMLKIVNAAYASGALSVDSYALVLKRRSLFVPTLWGVTINDHDRAYFLLAKMPNNRHRSKAAGVYLRQLTADDVDSLPKVVSDEEGMDRATWADRWYDMRASDRERVTYLLSVANRVVGYLTITIARDRSSVTVDEVAVDKGSQGQGLGGVLMRWAETTARQVGASELLLWGIESAVSRYEHMGYKKDVSIEPMRLDGKDYLPMRKRILYHLKPDHTGALTHH